MTGFAAFLKYTIRRGMSFPGRSRSYTRRLYKTSLKGGSRPTVAVRRKSLHVLNVLEVAVPGSGSGGRLTILL